MYCCIPQFITGRCKDSLCSLCSHRAAIYFRQKTVNMFSGFSTENTSGCSEAKHVNHIHLWRLTNVRKHTHEKFHLRFLHQLNTPSKAPYSQLNIKHTCWLLSAGLKEPDLHHPLCSMALRRCSMSTILCCAVASAQGLNEKTPDWLARPHFLPRHHVRPYASK